MAKRNRRAIRGRKKTRGRKSKRKTSRSSVARRGVTVTMTMTELRKYLRGGKKTKKKGKKKSSRKSSDLSFLKSLLNEPTHAPKKHKGRPAGYDLSSTSCPTCGGMQYEKDVGGYTEFYCPDCDRTTRKILL